MYIDETLKEILEKEMSVLNQQRRQELVELDARFNRMVRDGIVQPEGYRATPISPLPTMAIARG